MKSDADHEATFWSRVDKSGGPVSCWPWTGAKNATGYGISFYAGKTWRAHRLALHLVAGQLPAGQVVIHSCDNRDCCNPAHLSVGSQKLNVADMFKKGRANRPKGVAQYLSKLTPEKVAAIRAFVWSDVLEHSHIAQVFGVHRTTIRDVINYRNWKGK